MPRSRNSRSASPQKSVSAENIAEIERRKAVQNVHDIFRDAVDIDVIRLVLHECSWKEEDAVEKLLVIAESHEEQRRYKSKLHRIAEENRLQFTILQDVNMGISVFGSLRSEDYGSTSVVTAASSLSPSERVIRRPPKPTATCDKTETNTPTLKDAGSSEQLLARGLAPTFYLSGAQGNENSSVDEIEMDLHFPQLPTKTSETNLSSASSSVSSQKSHSELAKTPSSSKTALLSQAQSAFNQQFDDAEGTQRWEQYKQKLSEHYLINLTKDKAGVASRGRSIAVSPKQSASIPDDPAILQAELESPRSDNVIQTEIERPRSESSRSFPVRLLSRSPDTVEDNVKSTGSVTGQNAPTKAKVESGNLDSADLDETVLKCIYEVQGDLLDDRELERSSLSQNAERKNSTTPTSLGQTAVTSVNKPVAQQSNEAMTLPTIGLSVDAEEFVPRAKPAVSAVKVITATELIESSPQPTSKVTKSSSIEIKSGVKNAQIKSSTGSVGSPLTVSPSLSPGISPPTTLMSSPVANLTGSPMFITPKWPPVLHTINHPPPMTPTVLASTTSRFVSPTPTHHLSPPGYRFPAGVPLPYSSRMVYTVTPPPPLFRMARMPQYVQQPNIQMGEHLEDRAAIATGQPIMATSESSRLISLSAGLSTVKLINQTYIEQKVEKIHTLQKSGLKAIVIVRGLPGSGKSTLARALQLNGIVLSTDDYFMKGNTYEYVPDKLTEAHQWNRERTKEAMKLGKSPVIIDNTNTQTWEFKPYASLALTYNYHIELMEPSTPWKYKASELARRTLHGVPQDQIERMSNRYEHNITVDMLIRKRKADTKSSENDGIEEVNDLTNAYIKHNENIGSLDEVNINNSQVNESRSVKDLRLQNFSKTDDFRKQKSVESDSDSISSYHSGSISNQSSRNASPKPLRPSLKTPGALQKMEKLKPPATTKPLAITPTVRKVKRKAIKQMELKLSVETVHIVNDMVNENVGERIISVDDVGQLEEELKALLIIYPVNESEIPAAEELIGLKLQDFINQSAEIPEDEDDDDEEETSDKESPKNDVYSDGIVLEIPSSDAHENISKKVKGFNDCVNKAYSENETQCSETSGDSEVKTLEIDLLKNVLNSECKAEYSDLQLPLPDRNNTERAFPSWAAIAHNKNGQTVNLDCKKSVGDIDMFGCTDSVDFEASGSVGIKSNNFELQYWGKDVENKTDIMLSDVIQNPWNDIGLGDCQGLVSESGQVEHTDIEEHVAKPQRKKRNRVNDTSPDLIAVQPSAVIESNNIDDNAERTPIVDEFNELSVEENEILQNDNSTQIDIIDKQLGENNAGVKTVNKEETCIEVNKETDAESKFESCHGSLFTKEKEVSSVIVNDCDVVDTLCSNIEIHRSQSQDSNHEIPYQNSSLQMLKESYVDAEGAIHPTDDDNKGVTEGIDFRNNEETETYERSLNSYTEIESSEDIKKNNEIILEEKSSESLTLRQEENEKLVESKSRENLALSEDDKNIKESQSAESFTLSEDSEIDGSARSESDFEMTPQTSPKKSLTPLSSQQNKKPSRRKMAANLGPFLKNEDREKFKTTAWNSFPLHVPEKQVLSPTSSNLSNGKDVTNAMTMTDVAYFNLTERLNRGEFVDSSINCLIGRRKKLVTGLNTSVESNNVCSIGSLVEVHTSEKSTSTDDFAPLTDLESVEFFRTCFPTVPLGELECVLENCDNNTEWAINLLLDWKYSLNLSEDEKKKFAEGIAVLKRSSPAAVEPSSAQSNSGPSSLLDICFSLVEKEKIASREEIEKQLIQTGKERLDRIEDDNITKIRLHRSTSFDTRRTSPELKGPIVSRSISSPAQIDTNVTLFQSSDNTKDIFTENKDVNDKSNGLDYKNIAIDTADVDEVCNLEFINDHENRITGETNDVDSADALTNHAETEAEGLDIKPAVSIKVDTDVIGQLEDLFGPVGNRSDIKEGLSVPLDRKTAWLMYQCVKKGILVKRSLQQKEQQQLVEDAELARQLQEEENAYMKPGFENGRNQRKAAATKARRTTPLVGLSVLGTIPQHRETVAWNKGHQSLAEIMQEEQRIQDSQEEFKKLLEKEGGNTAIATCLKRQNLYGRFPKLDKKLLDEILEANCFSLTETIAAISTSLGESAENPPVTDTQGDSLSDHKLLEATKQQSMQEMLDSYIYHSVASKDYQDGSEPEYEDYRGEANLHFRLRHECFQKAREAHRRGLRQVATFYSQQGHQHTNKIKEANMRASEQILADRNSDLEKNMTLDLHGLHVDEAIAALTRIIPLKEKERCKKLTVITGRGSHSRGGIARLRPSVMVFLNTNKYSYTEVQLGVFSVSLRYRGPDR